jgi:hypothetical protein
MARVVCPNCAAKIKLPEFIRQALIRCPRCANFFWADLTAPPATDRGTKGDLRPASETVGGRPATPDKAAPATTRAVPLLTSPHHCQHCQQPLPSPTGRPRATVECPACTNKTSVYGVPFFCGFCRTLLEAPSAQQGRETTCPHCGRRLHVPRDVLQKELPDRPDDSWFGIDCPNCDDELVANKRDVGVWADCPTCLVPLTVPNWGHYLKDVCHTARHDPLEALHRDTEVRCPSCASKIPAQCATCPCCGKPNDTRPGETE